MVERSEDRPGMSHLPASPECLFEFGDYEFIIILNWSNCTFLSCHVKLHLCKSEQANT